MRPGISSRIASLPIVIRSPNSASTSASDSPLPPCPETPNCERTSQRVAAAPDSVYRAVQHALAGLGPIELRLHPDIRRAEAVYRVALLFKDDVAVAVTATDGQCVLYLRSASRVGCNDLGVNRRRVRRLLRGVAQHLETQEPPQR